eukprot:TRINITY_DN7848_c0_g1_i2.p1 TRINITY_DN7848_c0_g1~~TRINITY_DN7848_c0_g1_i2.p1  ORF type:complete len:147 (-),score=11.23 TRINITY_DN7848_c0_g1_i2:85-468(-)
MCIRDRVSTQSTWDGFFDIVACRLQNAFLLTITQFHIGIFKLEVDLRYRRNSVRIQASNNGLKANVVVSLSPRIVSDYGYIGIFVVPIFFICIVVVGCYGLRKFRARQTSLRQPLIDSGSVSSQLWG